MQEKGDVDHIFLGGFVVLFSKHSCTVSEAYSECWGYQYETAEKTAEVAYLCPMGSAGDMHTEKVCQGPQK